jgi:site-specific recombinase XerD
MELRKNKLPESAENFLKYLKAKNKSKDTIKGYNSDLHIFFDFISTYKKKKEINKTLLKAITLKDLYMFISYLEEEITDKNGNMKSRNSPYARARKSACLKSYFQYIYKVEKIVPENIADDLDNIKIQEKEVIYLNK